MDPEYTKMRIYHIRDCIAYKKIIMEKVIDTFHLPLVIDKIIFTYIGFCPITFQDKPLQLK